MRRSNVSNKFNNNACLAGSFKVFTFLYRGVSLVGQGRKDLHCSVTSMPVSSFSFNHRSRLPLAVPAYKVIHLSWIILIGWVLNLVFWLCFFFTWVLIIKLKSSVIRCIICYKEIKYKLHFNKLHLQCTMDTVKLDLTHIMPRPQWF